jgi:hypothetical protein
MSGLNVLITNLKYSSRSGTETYVRDLGLELVRQGHHPVIFTPVAGAIAEELRQATIPVVERLEHVEFTPDIIHGHHSHQAVSALLHFTNTPAIFLCHDGVAWHDDPPLFPRILRYVPVDDLCRDRVVNDGGVHQDRVQVIRNFVDLRRFVPRPPLPRHPTRALVFSNLARNGNYFDQIAQACASRDIQLEVAGASSGRQLAHPEEVLGQYDLVFAKAKAAMEAMAVGCAVVLCDQVGLGPLVTAKRFDELRAVNFGRRSLSNPITPQNLLGEIARYDSGDAAEVSRRLRACAGLTETVERLVALYREVIAEYSAAGLPDREAERIATAAYMARIGSTTAIIDSENYRRRDAELVAEIGRLRSELERVSRSEG